MFARNSAVNLSVFLLVYDELSYGDSRVSNAIFCESLMRISTLKRSSSHFSNHLSIFILQLIKRYLIVETLDYSVLSIG